MTAVMEGLVARTVETPRLAAHVIEREAAAARRTLVLVHGNVSSSLFWQPTMLALPSDVRALAIDLRGFGGSATLPVDATRGVRDFSDDVVSVLERLGTGPVDLVGWSMGGGVVMQLLIDRPDLVRSLTLVAPVSPYGFGGTAAGGRLLRDDWAGTGAGGANPAFVAALAAGDTSADEPVSPRSVFRTAYVAAGSEPQVLEDLWVESMLSTATGVDNYPGDAVEAEGWPGFGPGERGVLNSMAPRWFDTTGIVAVEHKVPVLWIRGDQDAIVSDTSFFDLNHLGALGAIPGWPGAEEAPAQPMIAQTREVLDAYADAGGEYREVVFEGCGHSPHLERPGAFLDALVEHLG
ncbi:alpha/beta fold hydrolase [Demequina lignilytica]|uniref:Alpha/beta hydrolase n=1 Tax=Demequina lignilytica TaxID=3051663 RepID=A0AB35ML16_9MICO|nr:alpha/beta hydrolase [Demequina sp. SYSU T0a273]MDN4484497.1 alpha/beta hydrolase [Demequina sp. SYSU T0a273]